MCKMRTQIWLVSGSLLLLVAGYMAGAHKPTGAYAGELVQGSVPKSYGRLVAGIADQIGTGLVFEDAEGVIRFVSMTGMKEGELARYDQTPTRGGIPKAYGHLIGPVV